MKYYTAIKNYNFAAHKKTLNINLHKKATYKTTVI